MSLMSMPTRCTGNRAAQAAHIADTSSWLKDRLIADERNAGRAPLTAMQALLGWMDCAANERLFDRQFLRLLRDDLIPGQQARPQPLSSLHFPLCASTLPWTSPF